LTTGDVWGKIGRDYKGRSEGGNRREQEGNRFPFAGTLLAVLAGRAFEQSIKH
jgi:hypothetical protein